MNNSNCSNLNCPEYNSDFEHNCRRLLDYNCPIFKGSASTPEPPPTGDGKVVLTEVLRDLLDRDTLGQWKYKTSLKTDNGRDALMDAYQEALDLCMYLKQALMERE